jgi:hypothetical protein
MKRATSIGRAAITAEILRHAHTTGSGKQRILPTTTAIFQ